MSGLGLLLALCYRASMPWAPGTRHGRASAGDERPWPHAVVAPQGCGQMSEEKVRLVLGPDARPSGEAYVEISGPGANLRAALAKDRQVTHCGHVLILEGGLRASLCQWQFASGCAALGG